MQNLSREESRELFRQILNGKKQDSEIREILIELHNKGETGFEIAGAMESMRDSAVKVQVDPEFQDLIFDNCGTGGDHSGTFNISTTSAFVLSGAGIYVAKHGNRGITSRSGSADVLETLGFHLDLSPMQHAILLQNSGFTFMFAGEHFPAMKKIMPIRKSIPHRTIFNILGPLSNPAGVKKQLIGVFSLDFHQSIIEAMQILEMQNVSVVTGSIGENRSIDEVSISGISNYLFLKEKKIVSGEIDPQKYNFKIYPIEAIAGGDAKKNAEILISILNGEKKDQYRDIVLLNSALSLMTYGSARDFQDGLEIARESLDSGNAYKKFKLSLDMNGRI